MKTGFASVKLAIAGFVVPYMFIYSPQLLLIDTPLAEGLRVAAGACVGVFMIAVATEGYLFTSMNVILRVISFVAAMLLIDSGVKSDLFGIMLSAALVVSQKISLSLSAKATEKLNTVWHAVAGFLAGIPLSYFFQSPLIKKMPFDEYLNGIPVILGSLFDTPEQKAMTDAIAGNTVGVLIGTCVLCAFILGGINHFINKPRETSN
jgi:hypothetical protein